MSDQWWQKLKTHFKGNVRERRCIWALGTDSSVQQILWEGFGDVVEVMYDNGSTPVLSLGEDVLPDIILADLKLFRDSNLGDQIKEDTRLTDVPLLVLTDKADPVPDDQIAQWGLAGIVYYPLDAEELKLKIADFIDTTTTDKSHEISIDEFKLENLDEELKNLNRAEEPLPQAPPTKQQPTQPDNDLYTSELEKLLAEIDETPVVEQMEESVKTDETSTMEQKEEAEMKADKKYDDASEVMVDQEPEAVPAEPETKAVFSRMQSEAGAAASAGGAIEQWFHGIAEEKITQIIANHDFTETIEAVARDVVPKIAEELVSKEIERIKRKIAGE